MTKEEIYVSGQFFLTTLDDSKNYFVGETSAEPRLDFSSDLLPPGLYRVVRGEFCRVVVGDLPELPTARIPSPHKREQTSGWDPAEHEAGPLSVVAPASSNKARKVPFLK